MERHKVSHLVSLLSQRRRAKQDIRQEQEKGPRSVWLLYGSSLSSYEKTFCRLDCSIKDYLTTHPDSLVLDMMADATVLKELKEKFGIKAGLALTLGINKQYPAQNVTQLARDILSKKTWSDVDNWLINQSGQAFDLIIGRGLDGLLSVTKEPDVWYWLISQVYSRLNPAGGMIVSQIPKNAASFLPAWLEKIKQIGGIDFKYALPLKYEGDPRLEYPVIMLTRHPNSPQHLPILDFIH